MKAVRINRFTASATDEIARRDYTMGGCGPTRYILPTLRKCPPDKIVSKQDSQFFNIFSVVIGLLSVLALVLLMIARNVGTSSQLAHLQTDSSYVAGVEQRIKPLARVAVAGEDNSALVIEAPTGSADTGGGAAALPTDGKGLYDMACTACHGLGIGGAPKSGDKGAWAPRLAQGKATLYKHAIEGFQGKDGVMPAKGGRTDASDDLVKLSVDYMIELNQ